MNFLTYEQTNDGITSTGTCSASSVDEAMGISRERRTHSSMSFGIVPEGQPLPDTTIRNAVCNPLTKNDYRTVCAAMRSRGIDLRTKRSKPLYSAACARAAVKRRLEIGNKNEH
jgi:hypothetical protein